MKKQESPYRFVLPRLPVFRAVIIACVVVLAGYLIFSPFPSPRSTAEPNDWIFRIAWSNTAEKVVQIKWPIGNVANIQTINLPWEYRSLLLGDTEGAQLIDNAHKETRANGYASLFAFSALLPDVSPHTGRDPLMAANNRRGDIGQGLVYRGVSTANPEWDERRVFRIPIEINKKFLYTRAEKLEIPIVLRSPRFGLKRIGPQRFVVEKWRIGATIGGPIYKDMWFDGATPEDSHSLMVCGSDERPDGSPDPDNGPNYVCEHEFTVARISARVKLTYSKRHLKDWREIQRRVDALLSSFYTAN